MHAIRTLVVLLAIVVASCSTHAPVQSIGDSSVHQVKCPITTTWKMCVDRAEEKFCDGSSSQLLRPSAEELDKSHGDARTVSAEGSITRRNIWIKCEV